MSIDFVYAQARAQARHGERLSAAAWQLVEASDNLAQYLHAVRGTSLAPRVEHFVANSSPHAIERSLRRDWRATVENAARWGPASWHDSIVWTAWLPSLPAIARLLDGGAILPWMLDDPVLREFASPDPESRQRAIIAAMIGLSNEHANNLDDWWSLRWQALWPAPTSAHGGLHELLNLIREHREVLWDAALQPAEATDLADRLQHRAARLLRTRLREPVVIFCHLLLSALDLLRLRSGLIRHALFNDVYPEAVS